MSMFSVFLPIFLCKYFTTEFVSAQENLRLECLTKDCIDQGFCAVFSVQLELGNTKAGFTVQSTDCRMPIAVCNEIFSLLWTTHCAVCIVRGALSVQRCKC